LLKVSTKNAEKNPGRGETIHQQYLQRNLHSAFLCWFIFVSFASISNEHPETDFRCLLMAVQYPESLWWKAGRSSPHQAMFAEIRLAMKSHGHLIGNPGFFWLFHVIGVFY